MATGQNIVDEVRTQLNDEDATNLRWTDAEVLRYVNAASRQIVILVPESNVVREQTTVAAGSGSRQDLPAGGVKFIDVANYDATASEAGVPIRKVERDAMDSFMPEWKYETGIATHWTWPDVETEFTDQRFESYMHDPRQPKSYFLFPPADAATAFDVYLTYSKIPTDLTALSETWGLDDDYINAAVEYITFRCLMKDGRFGLGTEERRELWDNFLRALGLKTDAERRVNPADAPENDNG